MMRIVLLFSGTRTVAFLHLLSFLSFLLIESSSSIDDQVITFIRFCPSDANNTALNLSINYIYNLSHVFNQTLHKEGGNSYYYNTTDGEYPDKVYGLFLCRLFVTHQSCQNCLSDAARTIVNTCNGTKEATLWYEECLVRYSTRNFFSTFDTWPFYFYYNQEDANEPDKFSKIMEKALNEVITEAASSASQYATSKVKISRSDTLCSLVQCIPDLSKSDCSSCLQTAVSRLFAEGIQQKKGARVYNPSCVMRYELYPFFENMSAGAPVSNGSTDGGKSAWVAIGKTLSALTAVGLVSYFFWRIRRGLIRREERMNCPEVPINTLEGGRVSNDILREEKQDKSQELPMFPLDVVKRR